MGGSSSVEWEHGGGGAGAGREASCSRGRETSLRASEGCVGTGIGAEAEGRAGPPTGGRTAR